MTKSSLITFLNLVLLVPCGYAQAAPPQSSEKSTIVSNVDEVTLDLVVRERNKPVTNLKPDDIAITDSGQPVKLSDLHLVNSTSAADHRITLLFDRLEPSAARMHEPSPARSSR